MKKIVFAIISVMLVMAPIRVYSQEGDDGFSDVKFKLRIYATAYIEQRSYVVAAEHRLRPGDISRGFAVGGHFRFANFLCPVRVGIFSQKSFSGEYAKSNPKSRILRGVEFSLGYNPEHLFVYGLFRGGIYGTDVWQLFPASNEVWGTIALGFGYRINIGSERSGLTLEPGIQFQAGSEGFGKTVTVSIKRYH